MRTSIIKKHEKILNHFILHKGYLGPFFPFLSENSLYPFIVGVRDNYYYYNLINCLPPLKSGLIVLENLIKKNKKIILVDDNNFFNNLVKKGIPAQNNFFLPKNLNLIAIRYDFCSIQKLNEKNVGIVLLQNVDKFAIFEIESKSIPFIGVGCSTINGVTYPFNINIQNNELANWYLYIVLGTFRRGLYRREKKKNEI